MRRFFFLLLAAFFLLEFYVYQAFKTVIPNPYTRVGYWCFTALLYIFMLYEIYMMRQSDRNYSHVQLVMGAFLIFILPKIFAAVFLLLDDGIRLFQFGFDKISSDTAHLPSRRRFLSLAGLGIAGVFSALVVDGIVFGKYRYRVRRVKVAIKNLPESFKGYKIVQISDVHSGSFSHPEKLRKAINLINSQNADLVLFTGDMVNNYAEEFKPFISLFSEIRAKDTKLSVLGNHDYGDYGQWDSVQEHALNIPTLQAFQKEAGFRMLRNEHAVIEKNGEKLYIIGVENWGEKPFPQFGDLDKATAGIPQNAAKILMSHDPTHFDHVVKSHPADISLTLSGHTHGMQFGIDLKNFKWSPVQYRYKKWADLYESEGKYLYVNRGFGVIGFPGRVGVEPEITLFELV